MAGGQYKPIAIEPARCRRIVIEGMSEKDRANFSAAQGKPEMSGRTSVDSVHGEAAGFCCGAL